MASTEFIQIIPDTISDVLKNPKIDGDCILRLKAHMLEDPNTNETSVAHIFSNAYKVLQYMVDPYIESKRTYKVLCLGKVQSGKTAFFISSLALAFDNGYNLAYVIGGTKTKLKDQNYIRISSEFINNENVKVIDIADKNH